MEIANPIYDVVFKYLMEDHKVAKIFLSALTGLNIESLDFLPQELSVNKTKTSSSNLSTFSALNLSVFRLDFSVKVKEANGNAKVIIIEIQKSKFTQENMRFRKYLGKQYMNEAFYEWITKANGKKYKKGLPILPIYFLGEKMEDYSNVPVIKIGKTIKDNFTNEDLTGEHIFINALFHEGIIVNIPALGFKKRNELEQLLAIFNQENKTQNHHIMQIQELDYPPKYGPIIRRLQAASQEKEVRDIMTVEDDFIAEINDIEHQIEEQKKLKEEAILKQEEAILKQEEAILKQDNAIRMLLKNGVSKNEIAADLNIDLDYIEKLQ